MKTILRYLPLFLLTASVALAEPIKVACVGDSITAGVGSKGGPAFTYPGQLGALLGKEYEVKNFGNSGSTLLQKGDKPYDKQKQYQQMLDYKGDIYFILLGTNDSKPQNWKNKDNFKPSADATIDAILAANPKAKIYIGLPIPAYPGNFGIRDTIIKNEVIPALKEVASEKHLNVIDLYDPMVGKGALVPDKVHPNSEGYSVMAVAIYKGLTGKDADLSLLPKPAPAKAPEPAKAK